MKNGFITPCGLMLVALALPVSAQISVAQFAPRDTSTATAVEVVAANPAVLHVEVLESLARLSGRDAHPLRNRWQVPDVDDTLSQETLRRWFDDQARSVGNDKKAVLRLVLETTLLAQTLLETRALEQRLWGAGLARESAFLLQTRGAQTALAARVVDAFIGPVFPFLPAQMTDADLLVPSQTAVLEDVCAFHRAQGDAQALEGALATLATVARSAGNSQSADWALIKLADERVRNNRVPEAIALLSEVTTPALLGAKHRIATLQSSPPIPPSPR